MNACTYTQVHTHTLICFDLMANPTPCIAMLMRLKRVGYIGIGFSLFENCFWAIPIDVGNFFLTLFFLVLLAMFLYMLQELTE